MRHANAPPPPPSRPWPPRTVSSTAHAGNSPAPRTTPQGRLERTDGRQCGCPAAGQGLEEGRPYRSPAPEYGGTLATRRRVLRLAGGRVSRCFSERAAMKRPRCRRRGAGDDRRLWEGRPPRPAATPDRRHALVDGVGDAALPGPAGGNGGLGAGRPDHCLAGHLIQHFPSWLRGKGNGDTGNTGTLPEALLLELRAACLGFPVAAQRIPHASSFLWGGIPPVVG